MSDQDDASTRPVLPVEEDVMQLARLGEIGAIQKLFDTGKCDANFRDEQGVTPLHWAAIKGHHALCHFLLQAGAEVNVKGGDVAATPVLWAARSCNYYVVNLLLQHGADPLETDDQGFNLLQNASMDGNVFQILMLLHKDIEVDLPDTHGHTSLMWGAYKGHPACVELLLRWGASVTAADENGFTALHWSLVKGNQGCVQKLIEYGSDRSAKTKDGKTPATCAKEMSTLTVYHRALSEAGIIDHGTQAPPIPFSSFLGDRKLALSRLFFFWPFFILICCFYAVSASPVYIGFPLASCIFFALQWLGQQLLLRTAPPDMRHIHHTPFLAGIFAASLFWVGFQWLFTLFPYTWRTVPFSNLLFAVIFSICTYFYGITLLEDPGYVPKITSKSDQKSLVEEMLSQGIFDSQHFCILCLIRKPLRSKHCKRCQRCVAKHDHHCPWVNNCVAINNHRHFFYYVLSLWIGVLLLLWIAYNYILSLPKSPSSVQCTILADDLCEIMNRDYFTIVIISWAGLQDIWVTMLLLTQLFQIMRAQTTLEVMRGYDHGGPNATIAAAVTAGSTSLEGAGLTEQGAGPDPVNAKHRRKSGWFEQWKKLLGIDTFVATALHGSRADEVMKRRRDNPFTRGIIMNLRDFFRDPAPQFGRRHTGDAMLGGERVNYAQMYEVPRKSGARRRTDGGAAYQSIEEEDHV